MSYQYRVEKEPVDFRFAGDVAMQHLLNERAELGWEYMHRLDNDGGSNLLVFRRPKESQ